MRQINGEVRYWKSATACILHVGPFEQETSYYLNRILFSRTRNTYLGPYCDIWTLRYQVLCKVFNFISYFGASMFFSHIKRLVLLSHFFFLIRRLERNPVLRGRVSCSTWWSSLASFWAPGITTSQKNWSLNLLKRNSQMPHLCEVQIHSQFRKKNKDLFCFRSRAFFFCIRYWRKTFLTT